MLLVPYNHTMSISGSLKKELSNFNSLYVIPFEVKETTLEENEPEQVIHSKVLAFLQRVCQDCIPLAADLLLSNHEGHLLVFPKLE
jgi:penicillin-binding protein-related factor A (putative recombinase)